MPELPEAETVRRGLQAEVSGRRVVSAAATGIRSVRRHADPGEVGRRLAGHRVVGTRRRGKYIVAVLDSDQALVIHLGMSGQLVLLAPEDEPPRHTHVTLELDDRRRLLFVDPRTFGELFVTAPPAPGAELAELAHLGFDPLEDRVGPAEFARRLSGRRVGLKALLMDQRFVAGIGNIYSDEILFAAGLRHDRTSDGLTEPEARSLHRAMVTTLRRAVEHRGSSLADAQYRDIYGVPGAFQLRHRVYGRAGLPCRRCGGPVQRLRWSGRSTFFCPNCQR
ncbi:MAG TPA: bifunctional DNA-formamidopyrimidine glycosylase/DNA-(apurinic or apyrimidinic site) lyase [Acidimicrobiales bacterium]|nr:bifunctional DNA-formamidopyrimidine glycosylase/DNA-(apurinic or apyrimidinic site) lyase [Acidimicrobiales bacterium]